MQIIPKAFILLDFNINLVSHILDLPPRLFSAHVDCNCTNLVLLRMSKDLEV
jgi:hypothetical protein